MMLIVISFHTGLVQISCRPLFGVARYINTCTSIVFLEQRLSAEDPSRRCTEGTVSGVTKVFGARGRSN